MGYINGKLIGAQLNDSSSDLTPASDGLIYFNSSTTFIKYYNGSTWKSVVDSDSVQTVTNKITPIVRGSSSAKGSLELRSTDDASKGHVKISNGSDLLVGSKSDDYISYVNSLVSGFGDGSFGDGLVVLGSGNPTLAATVCSTTATNSGQLSLIHYRGTYASPTFLATNDEIGKISFSTFGTTAVPDAGLATPARIVTYLEDSSPSASSLKSGIAFTVASAGAITPTERMRISGDGSLHLKVGTSLKFYEATNTYSSEIKANASLASSYTLTLPTTDGSSGEVLTTDGSGNLSWTTAGSGTGDVSGEDYLWITADTSTKVVGHTLNSTNVDVTVIDLSDNQLINVDTITIDSNVQITLVASEAPSASSWRVVLQAK